MNAADLEPRPEYVYRCSACSRSLIVELLIPSEAWEQIADGAYALCPLCMDARLAAKGLRVEGQAFFRGRALSTPITPRIARAVASWRTHALLRQADQPVGNPALYVGTHDDDQDR